MAVNPLVASVSALALAIATNAAQHYGVAMPAIQHQAARADANGSDQTKCCEGWNEQLRETARVHRDLRDCRASIASDAPETSPVAAEEALERPSGEIAWNRSEAAEDRLCSSESERGYSEPRSASGDRRLAVAGRWWRS